MIDLQLLQVEKGGNPEVVRESQRKRFASVELVDEVLSLYKTWVTLEFQLNQMQQEVNAIQKVITTKKKAKEDACLLYTSPSPRDVEESRMPSSA